MTTTKTYYHHVNAAQTKVLPKLTSEQMNCIESNHLQFMSNTTLTQLINLINSACLNTPHVEAVSSQKTNKTRPAMSPDNPISATTRHEQFTRNTQPYATPGARLPKSRSTSGRSKGRASPVVRRAINSSKNSHNKNVYAFALQSCSISSGSVIFVRRP